LCSLGWAIRAFSAAFAPVNREHPTTNIEPSTSIACPKNAIWMFDLGCAMLDVNPNLEERLAVETP